MERKEKENLLNLLRRFKDEYDYNFYWEICDYTRKERHDIKIKNRKIRQVIDLVKDSIIKEF